MRKDCNLPRPGRGVYRSVYLPGQGYVVRGPEGMPVGEATPFRARADQLRDKLQRDADAKAKRGPRPCLCCGRSFKSEGIHHRMCAICRIRKDGI